VSNTLALRYTALAAVTLLSALVAVWLTRSHDHSGPHLPQPVGTTYTGFAAPYPPTSKTARGACGVTIGPGTKGVAHPVLPCGIRIYLYYGNTRVLTQVIDRGQNVPGRTFDVTRALAKEIGLTGTQPIRWRYAR
jgi:rare lipoprotein A (peptidoglycan hydrolase)